MTSPESRFWNKVVVTPACWLWTASVNAKGYGKFWISDERPHVRAHRFAYELIVGPIPEGLTIDHLCRVKNCVNPAHMEPVTVEENLTRGNRARGLGPDPLEQSDELCQNGHERTPSNTYIRPDKTRLCRRCRDEQSRRRRARQRLAA